MLEDRNGHEIEEGEEMKAVCSEEERTVRGGEKKTGLHSVYVKRQRGRRRRGYLFSWRRGDEAVEEEMGGGLPWLKRSVS